MARVSRSELSREMMMLNTVHSRILVLAITLTVVAVITPTRFGTSSAEPAVNATVPDSVSPDPLATTSTFYTIRRDVRRCASPMCGGYFIKRVNQATTRCADGRNQPQCYVSNIEWEGQPEVEPDRALLRGTLLTRGNRRGVFGILRVSESWQAATTKSASGDYYRVRDRGLRCIAAPCETHHEARLNTTASRDIAGVDLSGVGASDSVMSDVSQTMTSTEGIIVTGTHSPEVGPAGRSVKLTATQLFLRSKSSVSLKPCIKTGCSGQICADEEMMSTCEYRAEYACYKKALCERQSNGNCGFTQTPELRSCLRRR
jgi:hypothetical protein